MRNFLSDSFSTLIAFGLFYAFAFRGVFPVVNGQALSVNVTNSETQAVTQETITMFTGFNTLNFVFAFLLATLLGSLVAFGLRYLFANFEFTLFQRRVYTNGTKVNRKESKEAVTAGGIEH